MTSIQNIQPLSAVDLFNLLKKEFPPYINEKLDATLVIEFAHVADIINVTFPEVLGETMITITVSEDELIVTDNEEAPENTDAIADAEVLDTQLLEQHLINFLKMKAE